MKKNSVKINYIYNLAFQLFALITPLITTPYVARVLTPVGVGQFSFAASINSYFCMFAALGFSFYAQREVAKKQGDRDRQSRIFWEIVICKLISGLSVFLVCWGLILLGVFNEYTLLIKILSIEIISNTLNIAFFFQGNEKFKLIAARDFIVRVIGIILIFTFVRNQSDLWLYALCTTATSLISAFSLWPYITQDVDKVKLSELKPLKHFLPSIRLFIPTIAISIYTLLDKTLIGVLVPGEIEKILSDGKVVVERLADVENGYYAQSEKIIKMAMMVLASLGTVMMPRNAKELADGREDRFLSNINKAIGFVFFIGAPLWAGIAAVSFNFSPWFFGSEYVKVPYLMVIFSFMIIPAGLGNVLGQQYLIPKGEDKKYAIVYVSSAVLNLFLNVLFIPRFLSYGAAVASVLAEAVAPTIMLYFLRRKIQVKTIVKENWKSLACAGIMFLCVYGTSSLMKTSVISTLILVLEGIIVYVGTSIIFKSALAWEAINIVKSRFAKSANGNK